MRPFSLSLFLQVQTSLPMASSISPPPQLPSLPHSPVPPSPAQNTASVSSRPVPNPALYTSLPWIADVQSTRRSQSQQGTSIISKPSPMSRAPSPQTLAAWSFSARCYNPRNLNGRPTSPLSPASPSTLAAQAL